MNPAYAYANLQPTGSHYMAFPVEEKISNKKIMPLDGMGKDVGLMREQWTLPSDHLPIGITLLGTKPLNIASWNVLNKEYMHYILDDYAGLNKSILSDENNVIRSNGLTERDLHVVNIVVGELLGSNQYPRDVLALHECSQAFIECLKEKLPSNVDLIMSTKNEKDQSIMLYNKERFNCLENKIQSGLYSDRPKRPLMNILLEDKENKALYRCLTSHLPWIPNGPAPKELAVYIQEQLEHLSSDNEMMIMMGDLNRTEKDIERIFIESGLSHFQQISPYSTYIPFHNDGTYTRSACFDHFFIFANKGIPVIANSPDEVLEGLSILANKLQ